MPENDITRLRRVFGIPDAVTIIVGVKAHSLKHKNDKSKGEEFGVDDGDERDEVIGTSALNTPVYTNIEFGGGKWESETDGIFNNFPDLRFDTILIQISRAKIIEESEIQGKEGKVKEYIGTDDWVVQVDGIIDGKNGKYPINEVADLQKMLDAPIAIDVACTYLQNLGIVSLVVFDYSYIQESGSYSSQAFSITFKSDVPTELRISDRDV